MREDPTYEELAAAHPELDEAGQNLVKTVLKETPNSFNLTPVEAFRLCADALAKMSTTTYDTAEKVDSFNRVITGKPVKKPPTGRRAAVEHTKRKIENGEN